MFESIDTPAPWAYSWCWVYFFAAVLTVIGAVVVLGMSWKKQNAIGITLLLFITMIQSVHGLTYFWICRSSLKQSCKSD